VAPTSDCRVHLGPGHVKPVWAGHPWVFQQAIERTEGQPRHGGEVQVLDARGSVLGRGTWSKGSAIACRLYTRDPDAPFDRALVEARLRTAIARRAVFGLTGQEGAETTGYRVVHGEGDDLPGLVVDRFGRDVVVQLGTFALQERRELVLDAVEAVLEPGAVYERTSEKSARAEGFPLVNGLVRGELRAALETRELGLSLVLPLELAQKTGYYFDQRPLRARIEQLARGRSVLDTYCFAGTIGLLARRGGAERVLCVDSSARAVELAGRLSRDNHLPIEVEQNDALRALGRESNAFDLVIADPPKLAPSQKDRDRGMKAFRRIAAAAVQAARKDGIVVLSSCSAAIGQHEMERCLALGARDVGRSTVVVERLFQGVDHPVPPAFPEGLYLSTLIALAG
jgi:23S rRNA (cytosine1962-C5)-methyltransferase